MDDMYMGYMPMSDGMKWGYGSHQSHRPMHERLVKVIQDCEASCEHMTTHLRNKPDVRMRTRQLMLLRDCADICGLTAKFVARNSVFAKHCAHFCAMICEICGNECARFPDPESQECSRICHHCARECRAFAGMG